MNNESFTDEGLKLLKGVSRGDEEAFRKLYDLTHKKVYFHLYRLLKGKEAAEDVLVETYTEVWRGAKNFKGKSMVSTWIMGIARNLAMNELRKFKYHEDIENFPNLSNGTTPETEDFDKQGAHRQKRGVCSQIPLIFFTHLSLLIFVMRMNRMIFRRAEFEFQREEKNILDKRR